MINEQITKLLTHKWLICSRKEYNLCFTGARILGICEKCIKQKKSRVTKGYTDSSYRLEDIKRSEGGAGRSFTQTQNISLPIHLV